MPRHETVTDTLIVLSRNFKQSALTLTWSVNHHITLPRQFRELRALAREEYVIAAHKGPEIEIFGVRHAFIYLATNNFLAEL